MQTGQSPSPSSSAAGPFTPSPAKNESRGMEMEVEGMDELSGLVKVDEDSADSPGAGSEALVPIATGKRSINKVCLSMTPCRVCGRIFPDMPSNKYCEKHRRTVDSMVRAYKAKDKSGGTNLLKEFNEILNKCPEPPSQFAVMVLDWEVQNPEVARGQTRCVICMIEFHEFHRVSSVMETGVEFVRMHLAQWIKYACDIMVLPLEEAQER